MDPVLEKENAIKDILGTSDQTGIQMVEQTTVLYRIDYMLGICETSLNKFKKIEIIQTILFDRNGMKLETRKTGNLQICGN